MCYSQTAHQKKIAQGKKYLRQDPAGEKLNAVIIYLFKEKEDLIRMSHSNENDWLELAICLFKNI